MAAVGSQWAQTEGLSELQQSIDKLSSFIQLESPADGGNRRLDIRRSMISSKLAQADRPIVIMGDSITEAALFPASVCGHPTINAGIGGMTAESYLIQLRQFMTGKPIDLAVIALGTNDASAISTSESEFIANYEALSNFVAHDATMILYVGLPPIEPNGPVGKYFDIERASRINETIRTLAYNRAIGFVDLRAKMNAPGLTIDGVHLNRDGYQLWSDALLAGIKSAMGCH
jgi:lysophospholipase L1-like esterase